MFTANKIFKRVWFSHPLFLLLLFIIIVPGRPAAQDISDYYNYINQDNGHLFFIELDQEFTNKDEKSSLVFDLTHLTISDTITMNFTYVADEFKELEVIRFIQDDMEVSSPLEKIFVNADKGDWVHRYSSCFLFDDLEKIYQNPKKASLALDYGDETTILDVKQKSWDKKSAILSKILTLIKANKNDP